jgi:hypothetical protein
MPDVRLSKSELAALDLVIQTMKASSGPGGFIGDIMNVVNQVGHAVQEAADVAQQAQNFWQQIGGVGGAPDPVNKAVRNVISQLPPGVTVDQLVAIRNSVAGTI